MTYNGFTIQFRQHVHKLSYSNQFKLAIAVCKRLFPDYKDFVQQYNRGDPDVLLDAIDFCQRFFNNGGNPERLKEYAGNIFSNCPDSEDFENASYAINACLAVYATLKFLEDRDTEYIYEAGTYLTDTADFKINDESGEITEMEKDAHPLMMGVRSFLLSGNYE